MCEMSATLPELHTAKEDIICYKKVKPYTYIPSWGLGLIRFRRYESLITKFEYKPNKIYETELSSFTKHYMDNTYNFKYISNQGFYSWQGSAVNKWAFPNVQCIIPKGSKYYHVNGVYISDKIKIVKELNHETNTD